MQETLKYMKNEKKKEEEHSEMFSGTYHQTINKRSSMKTWGASTGSGLVRPRVAIPERCNLAMQQIAEALRRGDERMREAKTAAAGKATTAICRSQWITLYNVALTFGIFASDGRDRPATFKMVFFLYRVNCPKTPLGFLQKKPLPSILGLTPSVLLLWAARAYHVKS